jgi:beta-glucosidase
MLGCLTALAAIAVAAGPIRAADAPAPSPWSDSALAPEERARLLDRALTPDERLGLLHGIFAVPILGPAIPKEAVGSAGYVPGVSRLGIPALQESDASLGVANPFNVRPGAGATPLPSGLALAATWDRDAAYQSGAMIGQEAWRSGSTCCWPEEPIWRATRAMAATLNIWARIHCWLECWTVRRSRASRTSMSSRR